MAGAFAVLRERNFRLLFTARTISFFGTNLAPIAVAFAVLGLSNSASDVGLAFAAWTLAQISTLLVGGVVADRLPRRLVMIGSDTAGFCVRCAMGALLVSGHARVWELVALQALGGVAAAFYSPASTGLVPETVPRACLQQANSLMSIARYAAFPFGAAVGGTLVATIGAGYALLLDGATYGTSALLLTRMHLPARARTAGTPNFLRELREGWLSRVSAYAWVGAMAFLPAGYALAGPLARAIGMSTTLWIGAAWILVTTAAVLCVPDVRNFRSRERTPEPATAPAAT